MNTNTQRKVQIIRKNSIAVLRCLDGVPDQASLGRALNKVRKVNVRLKQIAKAKRSGKTTDKNSTRGNAHPNIRPRDIKVLGISEAATKVRSKKKKRPVRIEGPIKCKDCKVLTDNCYPDRRCSKRHEAFILSSHARNSWEHHKEKTNSFERIVLKMTTKDRIEEPEVERDESGKIEAVRFAFGPHFFVQVDIRDGKATLCMGATHHGISADASEVGGELESFIEELKQSNPDNSF